MFALGSVWIGQYKVWVTTPVFTVNALDPKAIDLPYFEVSVSRLETTYLQGHTIDSPKYFVTEYYVNLMDDAKFSFLFNLNDKKQASKNTDMVAYNSYLERRSQQMPLWKLSRETIRQLFDSLLALN